MVLFYYIDWWFRLLRMIIYWRCIDSEYLISLWCCPESRFGLGKDVNPFLRQYINASLFVMLDTKLTKNVDIIQNCC